MAIDTIKANAIFDGAVDTADLATGAVTSAKLDTNIDIAGTLDVTGALTADSNVTISKDTASLYINSTANNQNLWFRDNGTNTLGIEVQPSAQGGVYISNRTEGGTYNIRTTPSGGSLTNQLVIASGGALISNVGIVLGNGTSYSASNLLDDYEEGTWTPAFSFTNNNGGHTTQNAAGHYLKVGNFAYVQGYIQILAKNSASGDCRIGMGSLPFTPRSTANYTYVGVYINSGIGDFQGNNQMFGQLQANDATLRMYASQGNGNVDQLNAVDVQNGTDFRFAGWIPVN